VAPGTPFLAGPPADGDCDHVRVTVGLLADDVDAVARVLALAASD
jgi:hypothetical protein